MLAKTEVVESGGSVCPGFLVGWQQRRSRTFRKFRSFDPRRDVSRSGRLRDASTPAGGVEGSGAYVDSQGAREERA
jgi:hypothetical protein